MANNQTTVPGVTPYLNRESPIKATELGVPDEITVIFKNGANTRYVYTAASCGKHNVRIMKSLALSGFGLASFIYHTVRFQYASRQ